MSRVSINMDSFENSAQFRGSFERGSIVEGDARLNSLLGSMIQPNETLVELGTNTIAERGDENSIEADGIP